MPPRPALSATGAIGAVPPGLGVVEGDEIPYLPGGGREDRRRISPTGWTLDPEIKCYLPGVPRATYMPYPVSDRPVGEVHPDLL